MKSTTAISYELDDIAVAASELTAQIKDKLTLGKNTVAILHGQPDMEIGELSKAISSELDCQVIGGTTAAGALLTNEGYHELAVVLHVLSDDGCLFAAAISGSMANNPEEEIENTYQRALQILKDQDSTAEPEMVICIATILQSIDSDNILEKVSDLCGSVPVFGFNAADDFEFQKQQVYLDGEVGGDRLGILLLSGNVKPIFRTAHLAGRQALEKRLVTKASGNVIYEIEGKPAYDYIKSFPFIDDKTKTLFNYQFFVEMQGNEANDGVLVSRALHSYDKESGTVTCFANVPENSYIGLLYCDGSDVANTCEIGIKELMDNINATSDDDYEYTTVIIVTCSLRSMFLADMKQAEGDRVRNLIPSSLTVSGLYAFGEMAPTSVRNNKAVNRLHNATLTACAF